jgi:hypothetical protein
MADEWTKVVNPKNQRRRRKQKEFEMEKNKWNSLENEYPYIVLPERARRLERKLNIDRLEARLLSDEFINYQKSGWRYIRVMKPKDMEGGIPPDTISEKFSSLPLNNGWGDYILFSKNLISGEDLGVKVESEIIKLEGEKIEVN